MPSHYDTNIFGDFLEEDPRFSFFASQNRFGGSPNQRQFFRGQFQNIHNEFLGRLGQQIQGGGLPTLRFQDFLSQFPFDDRFITSGQRGGTSRFAPPTQFQFGR